MVERKIPFVLLDRLLAEETLVVREVYNRMAGCDDWHVVSDIDAFVRLMKKNPYSRFEVYELGKEIACMSAEGAAY